MSATGGPSRPAPGQDFIREMVAADVAAGRHGGRVTTRFPPEPNGFLHIGHAKSICLNFGLAEEFGGTCNLRMDDTNPTTEDVEYVRAIERDVRWLGYEWNGDTLHASDYFERLYELAEQLILDGRAYVDSLSEEEIREYRGTVTDPGRESPYRDRSAEESLDLFRRMRAGEFPDGAHVLRARIDMAARNMKMRDPLLYRIRHAHHYRTGDDWPIYPMYDWAHPLSDAIEGITHSLCTLEFEPNRELYDWVVDHTRPAGPESEPGSWDPRPRQTEFARLNLDYTVLSKRRLLALVGEGHVAGWDDPRMPTIAGLRRRGVTSETIRTFCDAIGVARADNRVDMGRLEHAVRDDLNRRARRVMCVLRPLRVVIENYPEGETEQLDAPYFPRDVPKEGSRSVPFSRVLYIEREDFLEDPPKDFYRLAPGREVRLRYAYFIRCTGVVKDERTGEVTELRCTYDPGTRGGSAPDGRKVRGTIHWVSAEESLPCEVRLYDRLFSAPNPEEEDFRRHLNPESVVILEESRIEPSVAKDSPGERYQFERQGYFVRDLVDSRPDRLVFNRTVALRDRWERIAAREAGKNAADGEALRTGARSERPAGGRVGAARKAGAQEGHGVAATPARPGARGDKPAAAGAVPRGAADRERARAGSPELAERFRRFQRELGLSEEDADILSGDVALARLYEEAVDAHPNPQAVANWVIHDLRGAIGSRLLGDLSFGGREVGALVALIEEGKISGRIAKEVLARMLERGGDPREIVKRHDLEQIDDPGVLTPLIDRLLLGNPDQARRYREGQSGLLGFFVGLVMRETKGKANPELVQKLVRERLG
ncbi:MAG: glutamine--tRNA ligase/YqeY domain fusion protein [Gemmatimonadota bacterium]